MKHLPPITLQHYKLRPLGYEDKNEIFNIFSDPHVTRYFDVETLRDMAGAERFIRQTHAGVATGKLLEWGIADKKQNRVIGICSYCDWDKSKNWAELGFALRRDLWGQGIMQSVLPGFLRFGFSKMKLKTIRAEVDPGNKASIALLEKLDFNFAEAGPSQGPDGENRESFFYTLQKDGFFSTG